MSDTSQGPGWWQASDGKWYPPEQAPGPTEQAPPPGAPPAYGAQPGYGDPAYGPPPGMGAPGYGVPPAYGAPGGYMPDGAPGPRASWGERVIAYLIDYAIVVVAYIAIVILGAIGGAIADALGAIILILGYIGVLGYSFYIMYLNGLGGITGKRLTGLKVVGIQTGQPIGGGQGIVRGFAQFVNTLACYIGWFMPLWDNHQQTIGDKIMKTVVLKDQPKMEFGPDIFKTAPGA